MALNPDYVRTTFSLRKDKYERFKKTYSKYGDVSKIIRKLLDMLLEGKIKLS